MNKAITRMAQLAARLNAERKDNLPVSKPTKVSGFIDSERESPELLERRKKALQRLKTLKD